MLTFNPKMVLCTLLFSAVGFSQEIVKQPVQSYQTKDYQTKKTVFVNSLLSKMTLDEKLGQLNPFRKKIYIQQNGFNLGL